MIERKPWRDARLRNAVATPATDVFAMNDRRASEPTQRGLFGAQRHAGSREQRQMSAVAAEPTDDDPAQGSSRDGIRVVPELLRHDIAHDRADRRGDVSAVEALLGHRPSARPFRWFLVGAVLVTVAGGWTASAWLMASPRAEYVTEAIRRGPLRVTVSAMGKLAPTNRVEVGTELSGIISRVLVDNNDRVTAGQVLAELDPSKLDDAVLRAQAALRVAEANVGTAEATVNETRAALSRLQQVWRLSNGKAPSKAELETAEAAFARAEAAHMSATAEVSRARAQLSSDQTDRAKAVIRAPIAGVVLARQAEPGQTVAASFQTPVLFTIAGDLTTMKLEVSIDEADVGRVKPGQSVTFRVDAFPDRTFPADIVRLNLGPKTSSATQGSGATQTAPAPTSVVTYTAVLRVNNADGSLRPGMTGTATIVTDERKDVLLAPNAALRFKPAAPETPASGGLLGSLLDGETPEPSATEDQSTTQAKGGQRHLYVIGDDGKLRETSIKAGATDGRQTEILEGNLSDESEVVTGRKAPGA